MWLDLFCTAYQIPYNGVVAGFVLANYAVVAGARLGARRMGGSCGGCESEFIFVVIE